YAKDGEQLIHRPKEIYDGAIPSGNAVATYCLVRLAALTGNTDFIDYLDIQLKYLASNMDHPMSHNFSNITFLNHIYQTRELVCVNKIKDNQIEEFLRDNFMPDLTVIMKTATNQEELNQVSPFTKDYVLNEARTSYYLCENRSCRAPVYSLEDLKELLDSK
ncbi:MAG: thioredoxin protein, partial [Anaerocolumna sp.]|nr:thioredoxin protein [Anaerocolumna sp.]